MPVHPFKPIKGSLVEFTISSKNLKNNLLGDPNKRRVCVYLPENYNTSNKNYPFFMSLASFTSSSLKQLAWGAYTETLPQRIERLIHEKKMGDVIVVFPDCFTSLGGNQYINSEAMGNWADYLNEEVLPEVESRFRTIRKKEARAIFGKSSGGYGALVYGMKYAHLWGAVACHSGDIGFELLYKSEFPVCLTKLASYRNDITFFLESLEKEKNLSGDNFCALMCLAMCATYAPNPKNPKGIELPVNFETCEIIEALWNKWLEHDPLTLIENKTVQENLSSLNALFIDCGYKDEYHLHYGARKLKRKLESYEIKHHYEEFEGTHSQTNHRFDTSLPFLYKALEK